LVYFGTYTGFKFTRRGKNTGHSNSKGIYVARFRPATGELGEPQLAAEIANPSFLAIAPDSRYLYSVSEDPLSVGPYLDKGSFAASYAIDRATGKLTPLNSVPSGGTSTCYISVDKTGRYVMLANYGSGSVSVRRVKDDGSLGDQTSLVQHTGKSVEPLTQEAPHAHSLDVSSDNRFAVASDLGADKVIVYRFDAATGALSSTDPPFLPIRPAGAGPRHFTFSPNGKFGYVACEMKGLIKAFAWDGQRGALREIQTLETFPQGATTNKTALAFNPYRSAEIRFHPSGRFVYSSNRGSDTLLVFAVDQNNGTITKVDEVSSRGLMPRNFGVDPTGAYLLAANEVTDDVVVFKIDPDSGRLTPTRVTIKVDTPVCVQFVQAA
jgi:6-phosphogluconolactonase